MRLTREDMDAIADSWYSGVRHGIGAGYDDERRRMLECCKSSSAAKRYKERLKAFRMTEGGRPRV